MSPYIGFHFKNQLICSNLFYVNLILTTFILSLNRQASFYLMANTAFFSLILYNLITFKITLIIGIWKYVISEWLRANRCPFLLKHFNYFHRNQQHHCRCLVAKDEK